ncbi:pantoate--beta-alanine ligase [Legionella sp. W05-934-2]|jgi:pantoate--beta-alanine ligase|uniref:pantoate--beta-alanine ligase n=1 Tax=Legionella sp. W05-934-2 TaxID=1198649 RepID=UPI0034623B87
MQVVKFISHWQSIQPQLNTGKCIGFVPTMGNLHDGHSQLIKQSIQENDITVVSIFVNDKQFNDRNDFANYPRTIEEDLSRLQQLGVDFCLLPSTEDIYADGYLFQVNSTAEQNRCEDRFRPGHFTGVLTVVMKLLQLVRPDRAYFGEKDYQQLQLIKGMVNAFFMPVDVIGVPTYREADGLPFSSRNTRLSVQGREKASQFAKIFAMEVAIDVHRQRFLDAGFEVEYLEELGDRRLVAVNIDGVRLIDNRPNN